MMNTNKTDNQQDCPFGEPIYDKCEKCTGWGFLAHTLGVSEKCPECNGTGKSLNKLYTRADLIAFGEEVKKKCAEAYDSWIMYQPGMPEIIMDMDGLGLEFGNQGRESILSIDVTKLIP